MVFRDAAVLKRLYPILMQHGMTTFSSPDVMRFLGHNIPAHGQVHGNFAGEVRSDLQEREEGIRIKHKVNGNSVKAYGKALRTEGSALRVETTINFVNDFKVYRRKEGDREGPRSWRQLRRGIADLPRRAQISQQCNQRYLAALASVGRRPAAGGTRRTSGTTHYLEGETGAWFASLQRSRQCAVPND